jgi:hypothetical protein
VLDGRGKDSLLGSFWHPPKSEPIVLGESEESPAIAREGHASAPTGERKLLAYAPLGLDIPESDAEMPVCGRNLALR